MPNPPALQEFLADLLVEQQRLQTPVARFAALQDSATLGPAALNLRPSLIPLSAPRAGEQYAFEVNLDACSGCKACVAGCHSLNGLDNEETWRDTGLLLGGDHRHAFQQTVTTACHHCADPACLNGCPVLAYDKDPATGIVRHLDDQCIGCSYCILKCPYDVPKYSARLGIVRKCDMCHQRLAAGEAPACVQACPTHAIKIVTVATTVEPASFLPGAASPHYTRPTTRFVTTRPVPANARAADQNTLRPQPAHWPLIIMLVCTQVAVGLQIASWYGRSVSPASVTSLVTLPPAPVSTAAVAFAALGLAASVAHLGQPLRAWRIFLGLRRSWLSREAVVFGGWFPALAVPALFPASVSFAPAAAALGLMGVFCSVMIYVDTRRVAWRFGATAARFFGTVCLAAVFGSAVLFPSVTSLVTLALVLTGKLLHEGRAIRPLAEYDYDADLVPDLATARLLTGRFRRVLGLRVGCVAVVLVALPLLDGGASAVVTQYVTVMAGALLLVGEIAERYLYFRTVDAPKMPGYAARDR